MARGPDHRVRPAELAAHLVRVGGGLGRWPATSCSSPWTSGAGTASPPPAIPVVPPRPSTGWPPAGTRFANHWANAGALRPVAGLPLHRHLPPPQPVGDERLPARRPVHQCGPVARQAGLRPGPVRLHRHQPRPPHPSRRRPPAALVRGGAARLPGRGPRPVGGGSQAWGRWLAEQGVDVPPHPTTSTDPSPDFPGADDHGSTWAPARFTAEQSETAFLVGSA